VNQKYTEIVERLQRGEIVKYREGGSSMEPRLHDGQEITVVPVLEFNDIQEGNIVLCKVNGRMLTHLVRLKQVRKKGGKATLWFQIANNHGHVNGWARQDKVYGIVLEEES
jgi:hypothetical protein